MILIVCIPKMTLAFSLQNGDIGLGIPECLKELLDLRKAMVNDRTNTAVQCYICRTPTCCVHHMEIIIGSGWSV